MRSSALRSPSVPSASSAPAPRDTILDIPGLGRISYLELKASLARDEYRADPVRWVNERLSEFVWSKQRSILASVSSHRRTAVRSCHSAGKSFLAARIALWWIENHEPGDAFVVSSAPTFRQVRAILWRELGRAHARSKLSGRLNQTEWMLTMPAGNEEQVAFGQKPADIDPSAFQGIHAKAVLVIFDEAGGIPAPLWEAADSLVSNEDSRFLAIGNPDDPLSEFCEVCKPGSGWNVIGISAFDTPNFTDESVPADLRKLLISPTWVEEKRRKWGETNPLYIAKVLGQFPEVSTDGLIPMQWIKAAQDRDLAPSEPAELGVDVGGGGDRSIIALRRGPVVRIVKRDHNPDTMQTLGNVMAALASTGAARAKIDNIGIGRGAADRAKELANDQTAEVGVRQRAKLIQGVNVGESAEDGESFANKRAEGYWGLRERFQEGEIDLDPDDDDLAAQLVDLKYKRTSSGKIQIESKDEIRRRGKPSPDDADAVMLAFLKSEKRKVKATWGRRSRTR